MTSTEEDNPSSGGRARPGAMTMAMQRAPSSAAAPRALRVGMIRDGTIRAERVLRVRETVTVGRSERNHFVLASAHQPARFALFQHTPEGYVLNFREDMGGRVALPGGAVPLAQLCGSGLARRVGDHFQVPLGEDSRGKVVVGDTTFLFQFVAQPPVQPRPQLPAAARSGFARSIDWLFTAFVVSSLLLHFGFVVYLENADWELERAMSGVPERYAKLIFQEPTPPEAPQPPPSLDETDAPPTEVAEAETRKDPSPQRKPRPRAPESPTEAPPADSAETQARLLEEARRAATSLVAGSLSPDGQGAFADLLHGGAVTANAEDILANVEGVTVADASSASTLGVRSGGGKPQRTQGLGHLARAPGSTAAVDEGQALKEERIQARVTPERGSDIAGSGEFDVKAVTDMVRNRLGGIRRCYEQQLRKNPALAGKVVVEFTIMERGHVTNIQAVDNTTGDPAVAACVSRVIRSFRFSPGPVGGSVTYAYPFVFAPQN